MELIIALCYARLGGMGMQNTDDAKRHLSQFLAILSVANMIYSLWLIYKYFLSVKLKKGYIKAKKGIKKFIRFISKKISLFLNKLGIGERRRLALGKDEYFFISDEEEKQSRRLFVGNVNRWKDLTDNNQKLRFLFIRYMLHKIRRGYRKRRGKTPKEWARDLHVEGDELELFESYDLARYGGGTDMVSDGALERAKKVCGNKNLR